MGKISLYFNKYSQKLNSFWIGLFAGLLLPPAFIWAYLNQFSPFQLNTLNTISMLYPSVLLGKICLLSGFPNMALLFVFYKSESFKLATGIITGGMPYIIAGIFMM